jgi:hypothetical protein
MNKEYGLSNEQIQIVAGMDETELARWIQHGESKAALNQELENRYVRSKTGQFAPTAARTSLKAEEHLDLAPAREPNSYDIEQMHDQVQRFLKSYPQICRTMANERLLYSYLEHNNAVPNFQNLEKAFRHSFTSFTLQTFEKVPAEPATKQKRYASMPIFPRPVAMKVVCSVLTPEMVKKLSADEHARLQSPMVIPEVVSSAKDYSKTPEFRAENPNPSHLRQQSVSVTRHEYEQFLKQYPGYARLANIPGVTDLIVSYVDKGVAGVINPQTPSVQAFKDAIEYLADDVGIFTLTDEDRGILKAPSGVSTMKVSGGSRKHWTDSYTLRKAVSNMSSAEFAEACTDKDFKDAVDEFLE